MIVKTKNGVKLDLSLCLLIDGKNYIEIEIDFGGPQLERLRLDEKQTKELIEALTLLWG